MISAAAADGPKQEDGGVDLDLLLSAGDQKSPLNGTSTGNSSPLERGGKNRAEWLLSGGGEGTS